MNFEREVVMLNGTWQVQLAARKPWTNVTVPGVLTPPPSPKTRKIRQVCARRTFTLTDEQAARSAVLKWGGIRFGATARLNGVEIGSHAPIGPHTILIPPGQTRKGKNTLRLKVPGWSGLRKSEADVPLIPVGADLHWGQKVPRISEGIWLEFYDRAYMKWVLAMPNVEAGTVTFRVWLEGAVEPPTGLSIAAQVLPAGNDTVVGDGMKEVTDWGAPLDIAVPIDNVKAWTPQTPHLYTARLRLASEEKGCNEVSFRFGMREFTVQDGHYRLNGRPAWLRGSNLVTEWNWGDTFNNEVERYIVDEARAMNLNSFRTHTSPPPARWLDVADQHGIMILAEFCLTQNCRERKFTPEELEIWHRNVLDDATGWMTKIWNHPSVALWVLSNEPQGDCAWEAGPYDDHVRALDPTRTTMRTGDMDPGTRANTDMHPTSNYNSGPEGILHEIVARAVASKDPKRTLTNTEYMNVFDGRKIIGQRRLGKADHPDGKLDFAECAMEHTEVMRRYQLDGIFPYMYAGWTRFRGNDWRPDYPTPMAAALHSSMAPVLASLDLFDRNFVAGREVTTPLHLINELHENAPAHVDIYVTPKNPLHVPDADALAASVWRDGFEHTFQADSTELRDVTWPVPEAEGTYYLAVVVTREADRPVVSQRTIRAVGHRRVSEVLNGRRVLLIGDDAAVEHWLESNRVTCRKPVLGGDLQGDVLLILDGGAVELWNIRNAVRSVADQGGRIVILDPPRWNGQRFADFHIAPARPSSRAFPYPDADHAMLAGIDPEWLKRWNGLPGTIADGCIEGEWLSGAQKLVWIESPDHPVAASVPRGEGEIVICLMHLRDRINRDKAGYDPAAERILLNLLGP